MNLHQTAALALVGWYMTVPPSGCNGRPNTKAVVQVGSDLDLRQQRQFQRDASSIEAPETNASHDASRWILGTLGTTDRRASSRPPSAPDRRSAPEGKPRSVMNPRHAALLALVGWS
jgi:hypothetical protein